MKQEIKVGMLLSELHMPNKYLNCYKDELNGDGTRPLYIERGYNLYGYTDRYINRIEGKYFEVDGFYHGWFLISDVMGNVDKNDAATQTASRKQIGAIYSVACKTWKDKFKAKLDEYTFLNDIPFDDEVNEIFGACSSKQLEVVEKIFTRPVKFTSADLRIGEIMIMEDPMHPDHNGHHLMRIYDELVDLETGDTWRQTCTLQGTKLEAGTKVTITAK